MNQILIITPEYFESFSSLMINFFTLFTSIATLILTYWMYKVAQAALHTWKDQDKHQTEVELMKFLEKSNNLIFDLRNEYSGIISEDDQKKLDISNGQFSHLQEKSLRLQSKLKDNSTSIEEIRIKYILATSQLQTDNPLRSYYQYVKNTIDLIESQSKDYKFLVESMNAVRNEYLKSGKELEGLKQMNEESFLHSEYARHYINLTEANKTVEETHQMDKKRWDTILENVRSSESILFFRHTNDVVFKDMTNLYETAKTYCEQYSSPKGNL